MCPAEPADPTALPRSVLGRVRPERGRGAAPRPSLLLDVVYGPERSSGGAPPSLGAIPAPMQGAEPRFTAPQESGGCSQRGHMRAVGVQERERGRRELLPHLLCSAADNGSSARG